MGTDKTPSPEQFWQVFAKEISERLNCISNTKRMRLYDNDKKWTCFMKAAMKLIIDKLHYNKRDFCTEYLRIDYTICPGESPVSWDLDIAIEHENKLYLWEDELTKLLHINCGLRVLIAYYDNKNDKDLQKIRTMIVDSIAKRKYYTDDQNWLLIFGPYFLNNDGDFVAYKLVRKEPLELTKHVILR
ncbi:MAG: hypothetical protein IPJ86_05975 [Bacteroidetes bacterium]|nr:hypothetical protein [Bacteroidota bacterium]